MCVIQIRCHGGRFLHVNRDTDREPYTLTVYHSYGIGSYTVLSPLQYCLLYISVYPIQQALIRLLYGGLVLLQYCLPLYTSIMKRDIVCHGSVLSTGGQPIFQSSYFVDLKHVNLKMCNVSSMSFKYHAVQKNALLWSSSGRRSF